MIAVHFGKNSSACPRVLQPRLYWGHVLLRTSCLFCP